MKIDFDSAGSNFIEIKEENGKIFVSLACEDIKQGKGNLIINSASLSKDEFKKLLLELNLN